MKLTASQAFISSLFVISAALAGCVDDNKSLFDANKIKEIYQNTFPVQDIHPDMQWKTTQTATVYVTVNEDRGTQYRIRVFDANPLNSSSGAKLLAEGYTDANGKLETVMDYPVTLDAVFVMRTDAHNRHLLKYVSISNEEVNTTFGLSSTNTRATTRATVNKGIETLSPRKTESEIASMAAQADELEPNTVIKAGETYKIPAGTTFRNRIYTDGIWNSNKATVIIQGTWDPQGNLQQVETGIDIYIADGGKIIVPKKKTLSLNGSSALTVFKGGSIEGGEDSKIYSSNVSKENFSYNAGTIKIEELRFDGANGIFYNCGVMNIKELNFQDIGARLINQGHLTAHKTSEHLTLENGCYAEIEEFNGHLKQGETCALVVEDYNPKKHWGRTIQMGKNSMLTIKDDAELAGAQFAGPADGYALIKIEEIESLQNFKSSGNIYYEVNEIDDDISTENWMNQFFDALKNSEGTISKYGESPITIPAGDCTGEGNNVIEDGEDVETFPINYTYAFEDNYPAAGDYDFNDVVLNVSAENKYKDDDKNKLEKIKFKISLTAVGAAKQIGAGLRLVGIDKTAIKEIEFDGDKEEFRNTLPNSMFEAAAMETNGDEIVIPLFGDAHKVYGMDYADRPFINTQTKNQKDTYTLEIEVVPHKTQSRPVITKNNLDIFIAYGQMGSRTEIHLYEFREAKATANGNIHQENLDIAGNRTWAISVPEFHYPLERVKITDAYADFSKWATAGGQAEEYNKWYEQNINKDNIFK